MKYLGITLLTQGQKMAARAFQRIWGPKQESYEEGAYYDALYDGGEFSGPANAKAEQEKEFEIAEKVGTRFGLTGEEVLECDNVMQNSFAEHCSQGCSSGCFPCNSGSMGEITFSLCYLPLTCLVLGSRAT